MKLQNMFKKNRKSYIPLKSERPEVPEGLLKKCNKCGAAILTEEVKVQAISVRNVRGTSGCTHMKESG